MLNSAESVTFRVLDSGKRYVEWMARREGPAPARRKTLKVDQLVPVTASTRVFLQYVNERMADWVPHWVVENHQLATRNRSIKAVGSAPVGERLDILLDWSEKLVLEPNNSATGASYDKIGLLVAVCVFRGADGCEAETVAGFCETAVNDVPHTHAFLRKLLKIFSDRSHELGSKLREVNIWSDGGPAHFKCAEGFVFSSHLVSELRQLSEEPRARLTWNFMQSYHGKGPYDAEVLRGVLKLLIIIA